MTSGSSFEKKVLESLGVAIDDHGKMPDLVVHMEDQELDRAAGGCLDPRTGWTASVTSSSRKCLAHAQQGWSSCRASRIKRP